MIYNFKNISSFLLINLLPQLSGFILLKVYTDNFTVEEFGLYNALMAIPPLLSVFISLQLHSAIGRFYFEYDEEHKKKRVLGTIVTLSILSSIVITLVLFFMAEFLSGILFNNKFLDIGYELRAILLLSLVNVFVSIFNSLLVVQEKGSSIVKRVAVITLLQVLTIFVYIVLYDAQVLSVITVLLFYSCVNLIIVCLQAKGCFVICVDGEYLNSLYKYSLPLIFHQMGGYLFNFSSVIILTNKLTLADVALFSVLFKLATLKKIVVNSFNSAWQPSAFKKLRASRGGGILYIKKTYEDFIFYFYVMYIVFILLIKLVVLNWLPEEYYDVIDYIPLILGAYLFRLLYCFATTLVFFDKKTHLIPVITTIAGIINVVIVVSFSEVFGFKVAIFAFTFSLFFMSTFYSIYCSLKYKVHFIAENFYIILLICICSSVGYSFDFITQNLIYFMTLLFLISVMIKKGLINYKFVLNILRGR